jgi:Ca2+-binding RTX toxin-like protein
VALGGDGAFVYTPAAGYSGRDSFRYRAGDGELESEASVTIDVKAAVRAAASPPSAEAALTGCGMTGDVVIGTDSADRHPGSALTDIVFGGRGNDVLGGGAGRDCLVGGAGRDRLSGGPGRDRLHGGTGRDRLDPGPGTDRVAAGPGNDLVITVGNMVDTIDCGPGRDVAIVDRLDRTRRCERVRLR